MLILWLFCFQSGLYAQQIELYQVDREDRVEIWAKNPHIYPVTIEISAELTNLVPNKSIPFLEVLPPKSNLELLELVPESPQKAWEYTTDYMSYMGNIHAKHDNASIYRLPYRLGDSFTVTQGYFGEFSHQRPAEYSLDFDLPEGSEVYAARAGVVVESVQHFGDGGSDRKYIDKANYVTILHTDGTFADYSHLKKNGVRVRVGQQIRMGQLLGFSGASGYATGPHLHFGVKKAMPGGSYQTLPVQFSTRIGPIQLVEGKSYRAN